jgi:hypothetical protein
MTAQISIGKTNSTRYFAKEKDPSNVSPGTKDYGRIQDIDDDATGSATGHRISEASGRNCRRDSSLCGDRGRGPLHSDRECACHCYRRDRELCADRLPRRIEAERH